MDVDPEFIDSSASFVEKLIAAGFAGMDILAAIIFLAASLIFFTASDKRLTGLMVRIDIPTIQELTSRIVRTRNTAGLVCLISGIALFITTLAIILIVQREI